MFKIARGLVGAFASCVFGFFILISFVSPSLAQEAVSGPFTKLLGLRLGMIDFVVVVLAAAATVAIASREFATGQVTVFDVPTMPKYTVARSTYRYFNFLYVTIIFVLFIVVMERYEPLRQLLIEQNEIFGKLPSGDNVLTISIGSVALIAVFHYFRLPNSQIGPSWFLYRLRRALHKRARIPEEAQALANRFLSDDPAVFEVPADQIETLMNDPKVESVAAADLGARRATIDYQWAIVSYLYLIGSRYEKEPPYSSFVSNDASLWPQIERTYRDLVPSVIIVKNGQGGDALEKATRENLDKLRLNLCIFHACLHLFAMNSDVERVSKLKSIGLKRNAVFFVIDRTLIAKFMVAIMGGIAAPPLAFGVFAMVTKSPTFVRFSEPSLIWEWILFGAPMYVFPIAAVMVLKRFMAASWPIRATAVSVKGDPSSKHRAEFKYDIYLFILALSFAIASAPLLVYDAAFGIQVSLFWALPPAAAAVSLAVLIDVDVVDHGTAIADLEIHPWVRAMRATGFAILLGGIVAWLTSALFQQLPPGTLAVHATTAAFIGIMIGMRSDFHLNVKAV